MAYSMPPGYPNSVMMLRFFLISALGFALAAPSAEARPRDRDQQDAFRETREGRFLPLPMIEQRIVPRMRGADYLGPELNGSVYRLKFLKGNQVIWIDVDARTGRIIATSGR